MGKLSLGAGWYSLILVPIYLIKFGSLNFEYESILNILLMSVVIGLFLQMILFILITKFIRER